MTDQEREERPEWCERLHELAEAVRAAVLAEGWDVGRVAVVVTPLGEAGDLRPLVVRAVISQGSAATSIPPPNPSRPA